MTGRHASRGYVIREASDTDDALILDLLADAMGWARDERFASFLTWKHSHNPFGRSAAWVAVADDQIVGFRAFLRWEFETPLGRLRAARAVDTATHPSFRGRGIFRALTLHALDALAGDGVAFVFNTPNDQSRPGYLKMGWEAVGRVPIRIRPGTLPGIVRLLRARVPAERWPVPCQVGLPALAALADDRTVADLLDQQPPPHGLRTHRTLAYLRWRYGFEPLGYRALLEGSEPDDGMVLFRLRQRGPALEATIGDVLVGGSASRRQLLRAVLVRTGADYAICTAADAPDVGYLPAPGQGPVLTWRAVTEPRRPRRGAWELSLGDLELL